MSFFKYWLCSSVRLFHDVCLKIFLFADIKLKHHYSMELNIKYTLQLCYSIVSCSPLIYPCSSLVSGNNLSKSFNYTLYLLFSKTTLFRSLLYWLWALKMPKYLVKGSIIPQRDLTRGDRLSTYDESVLKLSTVSFQGKCACMGHPLKLPSPTQLARLGHFPPASQAGRLAGPVFYIISFLWAWWTRVEGGRVGIFKAFKNF
jgi:hypothetical protein